MASSGLSNLFEIESDEDFTVKLKNAGEKLVVIDFYATWCGPCKTIAPVVVSYAKKYPNARFLKVNVDECQLTQQKYGVRAMPTFILFRSNVKLEEFQGADAIKLEDLIKKHYQDDSEEGGSGVHGYINLSNFINKSGCECLNESDDHTFMHCLSKGGQYLESDCDEQLILSVEFSQNVKLHSLKINGPVGNAPKTVKIFINQPKTMDFDLAERAQPTQELILTEENVAADEIIPLRYVKFQNISNVTLFIQDNLGGEDTTVINYLAFIGSTVETTKMDDFKRVAGKKGESH